MSRAVQCVAEFACIHEGDRDYLLRLAHAMREAGASAVKFQIFDPDEVVSRDHPDYAYFKRIAFSADVWNDIITACSEMRLGVWVEVSGPFSLRVVCSAKDQVQAVKIHSADIDNPVVLDGVRELGLPIAVGTGGTPLIDLFDLFDRLGPEHETIVLHGYQSFPKLADAPGGPPAQGIHLNELELWKIPKLARIFPRARIGLSDHLAGDDPAAIQVPSLAVSLGAQVIEKHVTLHRAERREDYYSALEPQEFALMVRGIEQAVAAVGQDQRIFLPPERGYQEEMKRTVIAVQPLDAGQPISAQELALVRDGSYHGSMRALRAIGRQPAAPLAPGTHLTQALFTQRIGVFCNARLASSRLPRKALLPFYDRYTTLGYLLKRLISYPGRIGQVALATTVRSEDDALETLAGEIGVPCFRGEPEDVMGRMVQTADAFGWDVLVRVTGDDQFVSCEYIERALAHHLEHSLDFTRTTGLPIGMDCEVIDVRTLRRLHRAITNRRQTEHLTWYLDSDWICRNSLLQADPEHRGERFRLTLDYQEDYDLMREVARRCHEGRSAFYISTETILKTLTEMNPSWVHRETLWALQRQQVDTSLVYTP
jgi:N,N'-diacetyllegionaminate synthase